MLIGVLPLIKRDLAQFELLDCSLRAYRGDLDGCTVIAPDVDWEEIALEVGDDFYNVIPESVVLGRTAPRWVFNWQKWRPCHAGWYIQQIVKLAAAATSSAEFCLLLDADLIALRPIVTKELVRDGRAVAQVNEHDVHPLWYRGAERVLGMSRSGAAYGVTPAILSSHACKLLIGYLGHRAKRFEHGWVDVLLHRVPWTEYTLYYTFLEGIGAFDRYHVAVGSIMYGSAVWTAADFEGWAAQESSSPDDPHFTIIQSTAGIPVSEIRRRLGSLPAFSTSAVADQSNVGATRRNGPR